MIRPVEGGDVAAIVAAWNRSLTRDTTTEARFAKWLFADPDFDVHSGGGAWVAEIDGRVAGFVRAIRRAYANDELGTEPEFGWMPAIFVAPEHRRRGVGTALLETALAWHRGRGTRRIWLCGNSGSAPGYLFPGVDADAYAPAVAMLLKHGFAIDREAVSMSAPLLDFDAEGRRAAALANGASGNAPIETLRPETTMAFLSFLRRAFPGDWNAAARGKIRAGGMSDILVAVSAGRVVGYCQWDWDGHFGPFGVDASQRGKGVGALLFLEACRRLKAADVRHVWFNWADPDAARFYRRLGIEQTRRFAIMRKDLAQ